MNLSWYNKRGEKMGAKQKAILIIAAFAAAVYAIVILTDACNSPQPNLLITGIVTDAKTGQPIVGATVSDDEYGPKPYRSAITDSSGKYSYFTWMEEHTIVAQAVGYKPQRKMLKTSFSEKEKEKVLDFALERE
ncbi:MAG: hypothetical protein GTO45_01290 [Candidatus Aminicenantes bacterium]|nr:hypothetical protein [Candidatus Aminicenantes bacterium]NIN16702.1 hypothetical protein [Candidatus Aminicenantes bacterium]NIN40558.1 hypothetical protein [Candidatus Aminicenantes bacterium]NIN83378.1 hypothetical protein [Candidatus Aminicenantes bacterium]NIQ65166.1 hypothetical protein [Candidatus Aminicenantes bacterium]